MAERPRIVPAKGLQTAWAKSPPRPARSSTMCCPPEGPPGRGQSRATAATMRTTSRPRILTRPSQPVSMTSATMWYTNSTAAKTRIPAVKYQTMSPSAA